MARNGFKMIDAELHVMEPVYLWERYIDPEFRERAPRRLSERRWDIRTIVEGEVMAAMSDYNWPAMSDAEESSLANRYAEEIAANFDPASQVKAMDNEGLDLAVLYPTSGMYITAKNGMDPRPITSARFVAQHCPILAVSYYRDGFDLHEEVRVGQTGDHHGGAGGASFRREQLLAGGTNLGAGVSPDHVGSGLDDVF